jgi:hypothetical protein
MLMDTVVMIHTPMQLIGAGKNNVTAVNGIDLVFHAEGNIAAQIDIDFVKIMQMVIIVPNIIGTGELLFIVNFHGDCTAAGKQGEQTRMIHIITSQWAERDIFSGCRVL